MTITVSSHLPIILDVSNLASQGAALAVYNLPLDRFLSYLEGELTVNKWHGLPLLGKESWQEKEGEQPQRLTSFLSDFWQISPKWLSLELEFENGIELNSNDEDEIFVFFPHRSELDDWVRKLLRGEGSILPSLLTEHYCLELSAKEIQYFDSFRTYLNRGAAA